MILISDGEDNLSTHTRTEAIEMAQRSSVVIYTISTSTQWVTLDDPSKERTGNRKYHLTEGDKILQALAEETGWCAFLSSHSEEPVQRLHGYSSGPPQASSTIAYTHTPRP